MPVSIEAPPGAGLARRLGRLAAPLADFLAPRRRLESAFGNSLLEVSGRERSSGEPLSLLYAGGGRNLAYLMGCLYRDFTVERHAQVRDPFALRRAIAELQAAFDLLVIDAGGAGTWLSADGFTVPSWVDQRLWLERGWEATAARLSRNTCRRAERCLRHRGYTFDFSTGLRDFFVFYHRLYMPAAKRRFAADAVIVPRDRFLAHCRRGYLLRIRRNGRVRAAVLLQRFGRHLAAGWGGVEPGPGGAPARGLSDLLDYCTILHAWQQRCRTLDLGPSRPRLFDGVLQYKKKWSARVRLPRGRRRDLVVRPLCLSTAVAGFLGETGFLARDRSGPVAKLLYRERPGTAALASSLAHHAAEGIARYEVFSLRGFDAEAQAWAAGAAGPVALVDLRAVPQPHAHFCRRHPQSARRSR